MAFDFHLDPVTTQKLHDFGRRRRRLILLRGLCAGVVSLLGAMVLIAIPDYLFVLSDTVRYVLSGAAYLTAIIAVWITCLRMIVHIPSERQLARLMETTEPGLHEDLISAVELGGKDADPSGDSAEFRGLLQQSVAQRVRSINVQALLPWHLVTWWMRGAGIVMAICLALVFMPNSPFGVLIARAMAPAANLARVSRTHVMILEPTPLNITVPQGDPVRVAVELAGEEADKVTLELTREGKPAERVSMTRQEGRRFATNITAGEEKMGYRVLAGDAVTARYTISTAPRPYVSNFTKTFKYPAYTRMEPETKTEKDGHLEAIADTTVDLKMTADQPISSGELRIEEGAKQTTVPLSITNGTQLSATVPMTMSGTYKVHLVAANTQFENKFSPRYEIIAHPDLVPQVSITQPTQSLLLPPDEIVGLRGEAEDDLGLTEVNQMIRVNNGRWIKIPVSGEAGKQAAIDRAWDLYELKLKAGDKVVTKLVATDLKGNEGESDPLHITVSSDGFDSNRLAALTGKAKAEAAMWQWRGALSAQKKAADEAADRITKSDPADVQASVYMANLHDALDQSQQESKRAMATVSEAMKMMRRGADAHDLALALRVISRAENDELHTAAYYMGMAEMAKSREDRDKSVRRTLEQIRQTAYLAAHLESRFVDVLLAEQYAVATDDLANLVRDQQRLLGDNPDQLRDDPVTWKIVSRREGVAANQMGGLEQLFTAYRDRLDSGDANRQKELARRFADYRKKMETAIGDGTKTPDRNLLGPAKELRDFLINQHREMRAYAFDAMTRSMRYRHETEDDARQSFEALWRVREQMEVVLHEAKHVMEVSKLNDGAKLASAQAKLTEEANELVNRRGPLAVEVLKDRARIEESRPDADRRYIADTGNAGRAIDSLLTRFTSSQDDLEHAAKLIDDVRKLNDAYRLLDAVGGVQEIDTTVRDLGELEKWKQTTAMAYTQHPRLWDLSDDQLDREVRWVREAQGNLDAVNLMQQIRGKPYANQVRQEMNERRQQDRESRKVTEPIGLVKADVDQVLALLRPQTDEARKVVEALTPNLHELMKDVADKARNLEKKTEEAAKQAPEKTPEKAHQDAQELKQKQDQLRSDVADVVDALRQDANLQNPFTEQGRERARDADDATAMVREPTNKAQQAVEQAQATPKQEEQAAALNEAAQQQEKLAKTLDQLAEHFEKLEKGESVADSRAELRAQERELGIDQGLNEQYEQTQRLAELSQLNQQDLLKALEQELKQNRPMQHELSEISRETLEQAKQELNQAANAEKQQNSQLQNQAKQQDQQKDPFKQQLEQLKQQAAQLAQQQVPQAQQAAQQAGTDQKPLAEAQKQAQQAADQLPANADQSAAQLSKQLASQVEPLKQAAQQLQEAAQDAARAQMTPAQQAASAAQEAAQAAREAANIAQQAAAKSQNAAQQVAQAKPNTPQAQAAQQSAQQSQQSAQKAQQAANEATNLANQSQQAAQQNNAEQAAQQANAAQQKAAEAVADAQQAAQQAKQSADAAGEAAHDAPQVADAQHQAAAAAQQAADAAHDAGQDVNDAAADIAQAAKQQPSAGQEAGEAAKAVAQAAKQAAQQAQQAAQAAQNAANQVAQAQPNTPQAQNAQQSAQHAQQAAAQSQQAAQNAENLANAAQAQTQQNQGQAAAQSAQQAAQQANEAVAKANEAAQAANDVAQAAQQASGQAPQLADAQKQAGEAAQAAQQAANQAGQTAQQNQPKIAKAQATQQAQQQAQAAANQAQQLAQRAEQLANALDQQAVNNAQQLAQAAEQQAPIGEQVADAGQDVARAARHEMRLNNEPVGQALEQAAQQIDNAAQQAVPQAQQQLANAGQAADAQPAVQAAQQAIEQGAEAVGQVLDPSAGAQPGQAPMTNNNAQANGQQQPAAANAQANAAPNGEAPQGQPAGAAQAQGSPAQAQAQTNGSPQQGSPAGQQASGQQPAGQSGQPAQASAQSPAGQQPAGQPQPGQSGSPTESAGHSPFSGESAQYLARALDQLDQAVFNPQSNQAQPGSQASDSLAQAAQQQGQPGQQAQGQGQPNGQSQPGQPGQSSQSAQGQSASDALAQAAAAQAAAMAASRQKGMVPGENPLSQGFVEESIGGATTNAGDIPYQDLAAVKAMTDADWGKLPPQLAKDLMEGRREAVGGEYRNMVETYFRVIAERARQNKGK
ncbi:MAG: hypothetical protein GC162_17155 [Planctomycetes bacterium]|nr:hypothetical protein [Planctomycetota bacterium]